MSKRTSEDLENIIEIPDPNNLESGVPSDVKTYNNNAVVAYLRSVQSDDAEDSGIEVEEVEIDGTTYFVEVGDDNEECAIFDVTSDDELGDEIGFMLNGEAEFE
ncbi:hypothetical protein TrVE_jg4861 [Triparma verrucosa]|uniref:Uncharacterized protein n=1 Tax=Triparma verrucosa TaxID=1606542 RepID=A0A9W6ZBK8_9STRA|nr:hypothetical protein TrVE_jg4861 [Triparma verrucosa]